MILNFCSDWLKGMLKHYDLTYHRDVESLLLELKEFIKETKDTMDKGVTKVGLPIYEDCVSSLGQLVEDEVKVKDLYHTLYRDYLLKQSLPKSTMSSIDSHSTRIKWKTVNSSLNTITDYLSNARSDLGETNFTRYGDSFKILGSEWELMYLSEYE